MVEDKNNQQQTGAADGGRQQVIVRGRITKVIADKKKDGPVTGMELFVQPTHVKANGKFLEVWFQYKVTYNEEIGEIELHGVLLFEIDEVTARKVAEDFTAKGYFESPWAETVANNINFKCSTDAVFPAKIMDLPAPIASPRVAMAGQPDAQQGAAGQPQAGAPQGQPQRSAPPQPQKKMPVARPDLRKKEEEKRKANKDSLKKPGSTKTGLPFPPSQPPPFTKD